MSRELHPVLMQAVNSINFFSKIKYLFYLKDKDGNYLAMTDYAAHVYGFESPELAIGKSMLELLGEKYPKISQQTRELEEQFISSNAETMSVINFFSYADNVQVRLVLRTKLKDPETGEVLGMLCQEIPSGLNNECMSIMDSLGESSSIKFPDTDYNPVIDKLTSYEHEVCFLVSIGWSPSQIQNFLNRLYPEQQRTLDAIIKKKNAICNKFDLEFNHISNLKEFLIKNEVYKQIPQKLLSHLQGAYMVN